VRPLFLEFPNATKDLHPLDLDAGNEFLFGPDLLIAPPPFPEQSDNYELKLPPGDWYDYWTGAKIQTAAAPKGEPFGIAVIQPKLDVLPVYVREGAILPLQPLVQSTEETPHGPSTLRVYPGKDCRGSLYMDDGKTLAYTRGQFLRIEYSCAITPDGLTLRIGEHQGSFHPWWNRIHLEVYGWDSATGTVTVNGSADPAASVDTHKHMLTVELDDQTHGTKLDIRKSN